MENLDFACQEFSTAADCASNFGVTKHQFVTMFDEANGIPAEDINDTLSGIEPHITTRIERRLGAGIRHLDGLCLEHRCDAFDEWARNSLFFASLPGWVLRHPVERVFFTCKLQ